MNMIKIRCPSCGKAMEVDSALAGSDSQCPSCGQQFHIPVKKNKYRKWIIAAVLVAAVILGYFLLKPQTVEELQDEVISSVDRELQNPSCAVRRRIESAHATVNVTSACVTGCSIITMDGSNKVGRNQSNIREIQIELTFRWDGVFHKGGQTVLRVDLDGQTNKVIRSKIARTDAMVNTEDPNFWYGVGMLAGTLLL